MTSASIRRRVADIAATAAVVVRFRVRSATLIPPCSFTQSAFCIPLLCLKLCVNNLRNSEKVSNGAHFTVK